MEKKSKKKGKKLAFHDRINDMLEIPKEVSSSEPKITIVGFKQILIENYKNILEYEDYFIKINTHIGTINVNGYNLDLRQMTSDDIMINGRIDSVDFENMTDDEQG